VSTFNNKKAVPPLRNLQCRRCFRFEVCRHHSLQA